MIIDGVAPSGKSGAASSCKSAFLQRERWKAIQKARRKGMSLRAIERELGIHRSRIKKYLDAAGSPTRQFQAVPTTSTLVPSRPNRVTILLHTLTGHFP